MDVNYEMTEEAKLELHRAICYFEFLGKENSFLDDLIHQLRLIIQMPTAFQLRYQNIRIVGLQNFNYSIQYRIVNDEILILRILHQNQSY